MASCEAEVVPVQEQSTPQFASAPETNAVVSASLPPPTPTPTPTPRIFAPESISGLGGLIASLTLDKLNPEDKKDFDVRHGGVSLLSLKDFSFGSKRSLSLTGIGDTESFDTESGKNVFTCPIMSVIDATVREFYPPPSEGENQLRLGVTEFTMTENAFLTTMTNGIESGTVEFGPTTIYNREAKPDKPTMNRKMIISRFYAEFNSSAIFDAEMAYNNAIAVFDADKTLLNNDEKVRLRKVHESLLHRQYVTKGFIFYHYFGSQKAYWSTYNMDFSRKFCAKLNMPYEQQDPILGQGDDVMEIDSRLALLTRMENQPEWIQVIAKNEVRTHNIFDLEESEEAGSDASTFGSLGSGGASPRPATIRRKNYYRTPSTGTSLVTRHGQREIAGTSTSTSTSSSAASFATARPGPQNSGASPRSGQSTNTSTLTGSSASSGSSQPPSEGLSGGQSRSARAERSPMAAARSDGSGQTKPPFRF